MANYKYGMNLIRVSNTTDWSTLVPDVVKEFNMPMQNSGKQYPGVITFGPRWNINDGGGPAFITTRLFESVEEVEDYNQAGMNQIKERSELVNSIHERCRSFTFVLSKILINAEYKGSGKPGVLSRTIFKAKVGKIDELIRFLTSYVESLPSDASVPQLSEVRNGPIGVVRLVTGYENAAEAELGYDRSRSNWESPEVQKASEIIESMTRNVSRILDNSI